MRNNELRVASKIKRLRGAYKIKTSRVALKSLVTGANGFLGCHVVRALLERGDHVRAMVRERSDKRALAGLGCELISADLRDAEAVDRAVRGCDQVYHVAADYRLWVMDPAQMYAANVDGTRNILAAARRAGTQRVIYTSTVGALGIGNDKMGREDTPVTLADMVGHYKRSKFLAEREVMQAARDGLPVVIVNPSTPIGPLDYKPTPTGRIVVDFLNRRMPAYVETGLNLAPVEDVARGHLLVAERGRIGEKYILGGENLTLEQMLGRLAALSGLPAPRIKIPYAVAFGFALGAEAVARAFTRRPPRASLTEVRMSRKSMFFDDSKARCELDYAPGPVDEALAREIKFFRQIGAAHA
ncbi:MAG: hopanoid-associated sugar epimerase [Candidatus Binataceae bacterium]